MLNIHEVNQAGIESLKDLIQNSTETLQTSIQGLSVAQTRLSTISSTNLDITATPYQQCSRPCQCRCHIRRRIQSRAGSILSKIIGQYFLGYNIVSTWARDPCDNRLECQRLKGGCGAFQLHYIFPPWLILGALAISVAWGGPNERGASIHLSVPRVLPKTHDVWTVVQRNDMIRLQSMLSRREVFPTDVNYKGWSILTASPPLIVLGNHMAE